MTNYFVTRHAGARAWIERQGMTARVVDHLDPAAVRAGDVVMGTLPVHVAAAVCARGARFLHLEIAVPPAERGRDLTADDLDRFGARLVEYRVEKAPQGKEPRR